MDSVERWTSTAFTRPTPTRWIAINNVDGVSEYVISNLLAISDAFCLIRASLCLILDFIIGDVYSILPD